jgi:predicted nucleotidyltransferase
MSLILKYGLTEKTISSIKDVFSKQKKIQKIILYGSRAKGNFRNGSDIDLTLVAVEMTFSELSKLMTEIDDLMLPYKFDVSLFHQIEDVGFIDHINRVGIEF